MSERVIGDIDGDPAGPLLLATGAIHGNEPAGARALEQVFGELKAKGASLRGRFVGLRGNIAARERGERCIDVDLNRSWSAARIAGIRERVERGEGTIDSEENEQRELLTLLDPLLASARPIAFLDLHTSSGAGPPFATVGDTLRNRAFAQGFPLILTLGIEEQIEGSLLEYVNNLGHVTLGVEGGRHDDPGSVARHKSLIYRALARLGLLDEAVAEASSEWSALALEPGRPRIVEVCYRHAIAPEDGFRMEPGWENFKAVARGTVVAQDRGGPVRVSEDAFMLLPLYQGRGSDGFFLARRVRPFWLGVSAALRRIGFPRLLPLLPGVSRDPGEARTLLADPRVARWYSTELFHLAGFRKCRSRDRRLVFQRRPE